MSSKVKSVILSDVHKINHKIRDIISKVKSMTHVWSSAWITITYDLDVYYSVFETIGHIKKYFDSDNFPLTEDEVGQKYGDTYLNMFIDDDVIIAGRLKYYMAPRCKDSWILGSMKFMKYDLSNISKYNTTFRPGSIIFEYYDGRDYMVEMSKNGIKKINHNVDRNVYIDYTKGFVLQYYDNFAEDIAEDIVDDNHDIPNTDYITSYKTIAEYIKADDEAAKKMRYAYMDAMYPRVFIGFEDIKIATSGD